MLLLIPPFGAKVGGVILQNLHWHPSLRTSRKCFNRATYRDFIGTMVERVPLLYVSSSTSLNSPLGLSSISLGFPLDALLRDMEFFWKIWLGLSPKVSCHPRLLLSLFCVYREQGFVVFIFRTYWHFWLLPSLILSLRYMKYKKENQGIHTMLFLAL